MTAAPEPLHDPPSHAIVVRLPARLTPYARTLQRWRAGCEVTVLRDGGETYPAMLEALAAAERSICFETYILAADATGDRFKAVLIERARAGVAVRLIYDAVGSFGLPDAWVGELRDAGCDVIDFNPIAPWRARFRLSHRDHRKVVVVDDRVGFTGGLNIANDYASVEDGGIGWHDMHCRVTGGIVLDLARMFRRTWLRCGGKPYPAPPPAREASSRGDVFLRLLENTRRRQRTVVRRAYLHVIKHARTRVLIQNAYFLPDRGLRRALTKAAARGVDVRVMVPGRSDVKLAQWAALYVMRRLARRGVRVFLWSGVMMHAKTATVDGLWSTIGSYNFDAQSRFNNLEVTVEILGSATAETLTASFERDIANAEPFDERAWLRLPWWRKALAWIGYRLRRIL
ncbi:MAG TPA: phosphatidylserine/phosphatidylglycerophosphate/cardiolipin synthase family protein [Kofleriaceae bacterium]|jgi:cardiolipin synthase|nr:phosphatidylserine/phosphatidylglycerophosphate/cardiolipin synthase family protein [Kofleriaceae bacterium]